MPTKSFAQNLKKSSQSILKSIDVELKRARNGLRTAPTDAARLEKLCRTLEARGRRDEARREAAAFLEQGGHEGAAVLAPLFHRLGDAERAARCYEDLLAREPALAAPLCGLGQLAAERGDLDAARGLFERATAVAPADPQAWHRLGSFLLRRRDLDSAEAALRRALELDPEHARAQGNLGLLLDLRGERTAAERALQRAVGLAPDDAENHFNLGALYAETGRPDLALEHFEAGAALRPDSLEGHFNAGRILLEQARYDAALSRFARVLSLAPGHAPALLSTGLCHLRKGQHEKALRSLEAAARGGVDTPQLQYAIAQAHVGLDLPHEAVRVLRRLVERSPEHGRAHRLLGMCLDRLGDRERARASYQRAEACGTRERSLGAARFEPHDALPRRSRTAPRSERDDFWFVHGDSGAPGGDFAR